MHFFVHDPNCIVESRPSPDRVTDFPREIVFKFPDGTNPIVIGVGKGICTPIMSVYPKRMPKTQQIASVIDPENQSISGIPSKLLAHPTPHFTEATFKTRTDSTRSKVTQLVKPQGGFVFPGVLLLVTWKASSPIQDIYVTGHGRRYQRYVDEESNTCAAIAVLQEPQDELIITTESGCRRRYFYSGQSYKTVTAIDE